MASFGACFFTFFIFNGGTFGRLNVPLLLLSDMSVVSISSSGDPSPKVAYNVKAAVGARLPSRDDSGFGGTLLTGVTVCQHREMIGE